MRRACLVGDSKSYCRDNGKENRNYYSILGLYRDNGKENGVLLYSPET